MSFISNLGVSTRISIVVGWLGIGLIGISVFGYNRIDTMDNLGDTLSLGAYPKVKRAFSIQAVINKMNIDLLAHLNSDDQAKQKEIEKANAADQEALNKLLQDAIDANVGEAKAKWEEAQKDVKMLDALYDELFALALVGKNLDALDMYRAKYVPVSLKLIAIANERVESNDKLMGETAATLSDIGDHARPAMMWVASINIVLGALMAFVVTRSISKTIKDATTAIEGLQQNATEVATASTEIARSSEQLSQASTEQAAALQQTSASIEEMSSMVQKNSDNARRSMEVSGASRRSAETGNQVVGEMIRSIGEIDQSNQKIMAQINESNARIGDIVKVIGEIGNRTKVINDIVFQTKLLSFNASVEAARAGEHGKGFAVVAEEVGNLARMSGEAAKEISSMLESSIQKVEGIVSDTTQKVGSLVADGRKKVEAGAQVANQCGDVLREIVENVNQVTRMSQEISGACDEQSQGIREITRAVSQLDQVTQQNAAASEECASAAEQLSAQTETMRQVVTRSVQMIRGGSAAEVPAASKGKNERAPARVAPPATARSLETGAARVLSLERFRKDGNAAASGTLRRNVAQTQSAAPEKPQHSDGPGQWKKAVGADEVPDESDPRFQDV